ncbi:MAG: DEAD/DEAH box helicase [Nitriliruptoraceae bacterium]
MTQPDPSHASTQGSGHASTQGSGHAPTKSSTRRHLDALALRDWQVEALAAWSATGRGVVEAVTGTGKTRLALAALRMVVDRGGRALVLAPTIDLQQQWIRELRNALPDRRIGRLGGGGDDDLFASHVVVATPHSAASLPIDVPEATTALIVADEAHRYGAPTWAAALTEVFDLRLALTATYERSDDGVDDVLAPYFGEVVYRYSFAQAAADGTIAPFHVALVGVDLSEAERHRHDEADSRCRSLHRQLVAGLGMPREPAALFAAVAAVVADAERFGRDGNQARACREYLFRVRQRRDVAANAAAKMDVAASAAASLAGGRALVFTDTVEQAEAAARRMSAHDVSAETIHGGLDERRRRIRLAQFRNGALDVVVAPRVLDEGVDVPDADVAIVLAAFRTRRQMVQRLGRVLRVKDDGRAARLVIAYAKETLEDPGRGGHEDFLAEATDTAQSVANLDGPQAVNGWLRAPG